MSPAQPAVITNLLNRIEAADPFSNDLPECLKAFAGKDLRLISNDPQLVLTREADDMLIAGAVELGYQLLHNSIPENIAVAESIAQQRPVVDYAPSSPGAKAYKSAAKELIKLWGV